jgi:hypothetical protein
VEVCPWAVSRATRSPRHGQTALRRVDIELKILT